MRCRSIYISDEFCVVRVRGQKFVRNQPIHHCAQAYFTWKIQWKQFSQINFVVFQFSLPTPYFSLSLSLRLPPLFLWNGSLYCADSSEAMDWQVCPCTFNFHCNTNNSADLGTYDRTPVQRSTTCEWTMSGKKMFNKKSILKHLSRRNMNKFWILNILLLLHTINSQIEFVHIRFDPTETNSNGTNFIGNGFSSHLCVHIRIISMENDISGECACESLSQYLQIQCAMCDCVGQRSINKLHMNKERKKIMKEKLREALNRKMQITKLVVGCVAGALALNTKFNKMNRMVD